MILLQPNYFKWYEQKTLNFSPWKKLNISSLNLTKKLLKHDPEKRIKLNDIRSHQWMQVPPRKRDVSGNFKVVLAQSQPAPKLKSIVSMSQPKMMKKSEVVLKPLISHRCSSLSQPINSDTVVISTQGITQSLEQSQPYSLLVRKMTRFWTSASGKVITDAIIEACERLCFVIKQHSLSEIQIEANNASIRNLSFIVTSYDRGNVAEADDNEYCPEKRTLVDFHLTRGLGMDFQKSFLKIKAKLASYLKEEEIFS